jgi:hypothetical protein
MSSEQGLSDVELSLHVSAPVVVTVFNQTCRCNDNIQGSGFFELRPSGFRGFTAPPGELRYGASVRPFQNPFKTSTVPYSTN